MANKEKGLLPFLYHTVPGRMALKVLTAPWVSKAAGAFCDSKLSRPLIKGFVKKNGIDLSEYVTDKFACFNDCFTRQIRPELRPVCQDDEALVSPSDGLLSAYPITEGMVFPAKQSEYSVASMLGDEALAKEFEGGVALVIRLCVQHYHRYCYLDSGSKGENVFIRGRLHTVQPIALRSRPVFCENCREYTVMDTEHFGKVAQCEIGAMLVGKIRNHHGAGQMTRGQEKGMFLYGGSTIVLLLQKGAAVLPEAYFQATEQGIETPVKYGQKIGSSMNA